MKHLKEVRVQGDREQDLEASSDGSASNDENFVGEDEDEDAPEVQPQTQGEMMWLQSLP